MAERVALIHAVHPVVLHHVTVNKFLRSVLDVVFEDAKPLLQPVEVVGHHIPLGLVPPLVRLNFLLMPLVHGVQSALHILCHLVERLHQPVRQIRCGPVNFPRDCHRISR